MKEEPPDGQAAAEASEEMPQPSAEIPIADVIDLVHGDALDASASSAASEPVNVPDTAPEHRERASKQGEASAGTHAPGRKRKAAQEEGGPSSKKHGVGSMRDPSGRWRWHVAATDGQPQRTFPLDEGKVARQAALICLASLSWLQDCAPSGTCLHSSPSIKRRCLACCSFLLAMPVFVDPRANFLCSLSKPTHTVWTHCTMLRLL